MKILIGLLLFVFFGVMIYLDNRRHKNNVKKRGGLI